MQLGRIIRDFREKRGYKQCDFAKQIGLSNTYLSLIESDKREPSLDLMKTIGKALDINYQILLFISMDVNDFPGKEEYFKEFADEMLQKIYPLCGTMEYYQTQCHEFGKLDKERDRKHYDNFFNRNRISLMLPGRHDSISLYIDVNATDNEDMFMDILISCLHGDYNPGYIIRPRSYDHLIRLFFDKLIINYHYILMVTHI